MTLAWYLNRLRSMGPREVAHRLVEKARQTSARNRLEGWQRYPATRVEALPGLRTVLESALAGLRGTVAQAAREVLEGRYAALGVEWPARQPGELFPATLWTLDPVTGGSWPGSESYCFDIAYRSERQLGDIKYVWEINRLQFLQPLAADAALGHNPPALAAIEAAIASWHEANPPFRGLGWNSGIELALRAISLLLVVSLVGEQVSAPTRERLGSLLHAHAVWLDRYPSRHSSANNHLVAEAAGSFLIALAMPDLVGSAERGARARKVLVAEAQRQILPDGVPAEQSPSYGAFTAELLLLASSVAAAAGAPLAAAVGERLAAFADYVGWVADGRGNVPRIGDDDEGRVLTLARGDAAYPVSVARAINGHLDRPSSVPPGGDFRTAMFGPARRAGPLPQGLKTFPEGGYSVWRGQAGGRALDFGFDHGPLGYLSIAAHGHADALSVTLSIDGQPILLDPGTYLYHSGGAWRDWFRGTRAHNTLTLGAADQSSISGPFNWSSKARARLEQRRGGADWLLRASHDGYRRRFGRLHRRTVASTPEGLRITDQLLGGEALAAEITFQLAPNLNAVRSGHRVTIQRGELALVVLEFEAGEISVGRGGGLGEGGWVSPRFGVKLPADRIAWRGQVGEAGRSVEVIVCAPERVEPPGRDVVEVQS